MVFNMTPDIIFRSFDLLVTVLVALIASTAFWNFFGKKRSEKDLTRKLLIGLAHDRITYLSLVYIERGYITQDEYENLAVFLYKPYVDFGGNGSAVRLMAEVDKLPITNLGTKSTPIQTILKGTDEHVHGQ